MGLKLGLALGLLAAVTLAVAPVHAAPPPVLIVAFTYQPSPVTVPRGQAVTWINLDTAPHITPHEVDNRA